MTEPARQSTTGISDWATKSGSVWARRWRDTDSGLSGLAPHLLHAIEAAAPPAAFRAFEIGCGPGSTTIDVAFARSDAEIVACDIAPDLVGIARQRTAGLPGVRVIEGDAEQHVAGEGPFDLFYSRHGVMFFADPARAFLAFRTAAKADASIVFSCFQSWEANPWASELASAAAGRALPAPGREPSGFAFADPDDVREILDKAGWTQANPLPVQFEYAAGSGPDAVDSALTFFSELGPSSRVLESLPEGDHSGALSRMRNVIERHYDGSAVIFPAAAWIWSAKAPQR